MTINGQAIATLQTLIERGKANRPDLASRLERALVIVLFRAPRPLPGGEHYEVESVDGGRTYVASRGSCTCPDAVHRQSLCKHQLAIGLVERMDEIERQELEELLAYFDQPMRTAGTN